MSTAERKRLLRKELLTARSRLSDGEFLAAGDALCTRLLALPHIATARRLAAYVAVGTEPPTAMFLAALGANGVEVLLPVLGPDNDLDWAAYDGRLADGPHGLQQPTTDQLGVEAIAGVDVVLPALAADRAGNRLGRGGGSYDRALQRTRAFTVALLYDTEILDSVPVEPHDHPVNAVVTPHQTLTFTPRS